MPSDRGWLPSYMNIPRLIAAARAEGYREGVERAAALLDDESHAPGAQGYSGEPKHADYHATAKRIRALAPVPDSQLNVNQESARAYNALEGEIEAGAKAADPRGSDAEIIAAAREWAQFGPDIKQVRAYLARPESRKANKASVRLLRAVDALSPTEPPR